MKITIIGCGTMGSAFAKPLSNSHTIFLYDHHPEKSKKLQEEGYGKAVQDLKEALEESEVLILAIKPQSLKNFMDKLPAPLPKEQIIISLLAGTTLEQLKIYFPEHPVVRIMPNLAVTLGEGLLGICIDPLSRSLKDKIANLCEKLGKIYWLEESKMNAFTALAGSGPAFVFGIIEAMIAAGVNMGFNAKESQAIVLHMIKGCLHLLDNCLQEPGDLKWQIASPGGTTIAGLNIFEEQAVRGSLISSFLASYSRAIELSE